jgi:O-phosphoseryl-tRNA(Cys) synthetase
VTEDLEEFANKKKEKFVNDLKIQEKRVNERINPILELYNQGKIESKELVEKLSEAFYDLDKDC